MLFAYWCHPREGGNPAVAVYFWMPDQVRHDKPETLHKFVSYVATPILGKFLLPNGYFVRKDLNKRLRAHGGVAT
jgi:hypothetical protein